MSQPLVLSLFPGIGLLDMAFEQEGFCVVRGPDLLWGGDVKRFHPPVNRFDGIIGGPPCQAFSRLVHIVRAKGQVPKPNLIPEFERVVDEAMPAWFLMENVPAAPRPSVDGYHISSRLMQNRWFGSAQARERVFSFGTTFYHAKDGIWPFVEVEPLMSSDYARAVLATSSKEGAVAKSQAELRGGNPRRTLPGQHPRRSIARCAELQGLPADFLADAPFTSEGKYRVIGNGVPLPLGLAIAKAVRQAMGYPAPLAAVDPHAEDRESGVGA